MYELLVHIREVVSRLLFFERLDSKLLVKGLEANAVTDQSVKAKQIVLHVQLSLIMEKWQETIEKKLL